MNRDLHPASSSVSGISLPRRSLMLGAASFSLAAGLGAGALAWPASGHAATPAVAYAQGSIDPFFSAGYVALALGLFDGLDVQYINSQSGPRTNQLLAAGQAMFGATAATAAPALSLA
ncbi:MAG: hypothetical protein JHC61_02500, partial [Burkholderiaceae bacterium]|nr:hypothetical protein [Burkholderiaceae bacterium]